MESKTLRIFLFLQVCEQSSYYFTHLDDTPRKRAGGRADFRVRGEAQPYKVGNCILHPGDELALTYHLREIECHTCSHINVPRGITQNASVVFTAGWIVFETFPPK